MSDHMTYLKSISSTHLKEMSCFGLSGGLLSTLIEGAAKTRESAVQVLALGVLNQFAFHVTSHLVQGQHQTPWSRLAMRLVTVGLSASVFASLLSVDSFLTGCVIGMAHLFFHSYFFPSPSLGSSGSNSGILLHGPTSNLNQSRRHFFMPEYEDLELSGDELTGYHSDTFHGFKYFIYGLMSVIDLKPNQKTLGKHGEDCLIVLTHEQENLVHMDGAVSERSASLKECNYLVSEHLSPDSDNPLKSRLMGLVKGLYERNQAFPKKLFIPFNDGYHCAGLAIEFYDSVIHVTGFDSMGGTSMIKKAVADLKSVLETVCPEHQVKTVMTEKDQNNQLSCGFHLIFNLFQGAKHKGSVFDAVIEANRKGQNAECFPLLTSDDIHKYAKIVRKKAFEQLGKLIELNRGKILVKGKPYDVDLSHDPRSW
jgi:hypothetical protein